MGDGVDLDSQYDRAVAEYRFQVDLNWRRSEYFFVLNVGLLVAAATLFASGGVPRELVFVLFLVGALLAGLSFLANDVQHGYYRAARDRKKELENRLSLGDLAITTTPGMGSSIARLGKVGTFLKIMLVAIGLADITGAAFAIHDALASSTPGAKNPQVIIEIRDSKRGEQALRALVVSHDGEPIRSKLLNGASRALIDLPRGKYVVSVAGSSVCDRPIAVSHEPLQLMVIRC